IFVDNLAVDPRQVRPRIEAARAENSERPVVIQTDPDSTTKTLVSVLDSAYQARVDNVSIVEL
ncbi:MAG: ExbD/TolR family protein, partial [Gammaproteobacteria bacterium]